MFGALLSSNGVHLFVHDMRDEPKNREGGFLVFSLFACEYDGLQVLFLD
jgi:hypothetical protein